MITRVLIIVALLALVSTAGAQESRKAGDNPRAVLPHARRVDAIKRAGELLAVRPADSQALVADLNDPFYPGSRQAKDLKVAPKEPAETYSPAQLLARAAESIQPTGTMLIGTEPYLLLGGRRYKSGDTISVNVDGLGVQVIVSSIQRNSYTLRLNDQELRRDFK